MKNVVFYVEECEIDKKKFLEKVHVLILIPDATSCPAAIKAGIGAQRRWGRDARDVLGRPWCRTVNDVGLQIDAKILQKSCKNSENMIKSKISCDMKIKDVLEKCP